MINLALLGDKKLIAKFNRLKTGTQRKILRSATAKAARPQSKAAKKLAPRQSGALRRSIGTRTKTYAKVNTVMSISGVRKNNWREYQGKTRKPEFYLHLVERGTRGRRGLRFMERAAVTTRAESEKLFARQFAARLGNRGEEAMSNIAEDFKAFVTGSTAVNGVVSGRCHYNEVPQVSMRPHIWYQRQSHEYVGALDGDSGVREVRFDVECNSTSVSEAYDLADKVKDRLNFHSGSFGNATAQGVFVEDHDDDYIPKNNDADEGVHVAAMSVAIHYTT